MMQYDAFRNGGPRCRRQQAGLVARWCSIVSRGGGMIGGRVWPVLALLLILAAALLLAGTWTGPALASSHQIDYDTDDDNLIEIRTLEQLNAIRWNRNGNFVGLDSVLLGGNPDAFNAAFPNRNILGSCPNLLCQGYELVVDLDFDANGDGRITAADGDISWNGGAGWAPIGEIIPTGGSFAARIYSGAFQGNGHTIANMMINSDGVQNVGLFGYYASSSRSIEGVGLVDVDIKARFSSEPVSTTGVAVGALVGRIDQGSVLSSYATGKVSHIYTNTTFGNTSNAGGLVGYASAGTSIAASYTQVDVTLTSASTNIAGDRVGGLVGTTVGSITACYATGSVSGARSNKHPEVGGLAGAIVDATIRASYATGQLAASGAGTEYKGGLVGLVYGTSTIENSYWDTATSLIPTILMTMRRRGSPPPSCSGPPGTPVSTRAGMWMWITPMATTIRLPALTPRGTSARRPSTRR